jgi:hypothetical protein
MAFGRQDAYRAINFRDFPVQRDVGNPSGKDATPGRPLAPARRFVLTHRRRSGRQRQRRHQLELRRRVHRLIVVANFSD